METHGRLNTLLHGRLLVALFVAVISLPLATNLAGIDGADPGAENRELARFPRLDGSWASIADHDPSTRGNRASSRFSAPGSAPSMPARFAVSGSEIAATNSATSRRLLCRPSGLPWVAIRT